jgi:hemolysin activation/secretion protein
MNPAQLGKGVFLAAMLMGHSAPAWAQTDASTQEYQRQQERERQLRRQQEQQPDVRLPDAAGREASGKLSERETPCFPVNRVVLTGQQAERFQFALSSVTRGADPVIGRCLGAQGINAVMARIQDSIVERGYLQSAY